MANVEALGGARISFAETVEYEDGLALSVSEPEEFTPSTNAITGGEREFVRFAVRLVNNSNKRVVPSEVFVSVESAGGAGGDVIDRRNNLSGPPSRAVGPGDTIAWEQGFGVLDPNDVGVFVQAGLERKPVVFLE
jgi:hypothetical protein